MGHEELPIVNTEQNTRVQKLSPAEKQQLTEARAENEEKLKRYRQERRKTYGEMLKLAESLGVQYFKEPKFSYNIGFQREQDAKAFCDLCIEHGLSVLKHRPLKLGFLSKKFPGDDLFKVCPDIDLNKDL